MKKMEIYERKSFRHCLFLFVLARLLFPAARLSLSSYRRHLLHAQYGLPVPSCMGLNRETRRTETHKTTERMSAADAAAAAPAAGAVGKDALLPKKKQKVRA
jgi:hypothetical protein